jgi:ABC-type uncharacterized transport system substrate-binding protein
MPDSTVLSDEESLRFIFETSFDHAKPVIGFSSDMARNGAVLALFVAPADIGKQVADLAEKMLKRELPPGATLPPDRIRTAINVKTAKFLNIPLLSDLVGRADVVY